MEHSERSKIGALGRLRLLPWLSPHNVVIVLRTALTALSVPGRTGWVMANRPLLCRITQNIPPYTAIRSAQLQRGVASHHCHVPNLSSLVSSLVHVLSDPQKITAQHQESAMSFCNWVRWMTRGYACRGDLNEGEGRENLQSLYYWLIRMF